MLCERGEWSDVRKMPAGWSDRRDERKLDGSRTRAKKRGQEVRLFNRRNADKSEQFPEIVEYLKTIPHDFDLDGEMMSKDFSTLAQREHTTNRTKIRLLAKFSPCKLAVFDILELDGAVIGASSYDDRKKILYETFHPFENGFLELVMPMPLETLVEMVEKHEIEGVVSKNSASSYQFRRSHDWIKFRPDNVEDLPIIGYEDTDKPHRPFRSLILTRNGKEVQASSGLSEADLRRLDEIFKGKPTRQVGTKRYFEKPIGVAEIKFYGNSPDIPYRFPRVERFREDKEV
jgi:ATP-dependent DNA ligase